jgi:serine/threonine-protein kinase RsbW
MRSRSAKRREATAEPADAAPPARMSVVRVDPCAPAAALLCQGRGLGSMAMARPSARRRRPRTIELRLPSELGWERTAMDVAGSVARHMGFPAERIDDIKTAVSEATLNAIEHGNALDASQAVFIVLVPEGEKLEVRVRDRAAKAFAPGAGTAPAPNLVEQLEGAVPPRGWGTYLIRSLVDEVEFASTSAGNVVRMVIHLEP